MLGLTACVFHRSDTRSKVVAAAMAKGILASGDKVIRMPASGFEKPIGDVAVFYAYKARCREIAAGYLAEGRHYIYIDLGYWGRREAGLSRYDGYHRFSMDRRHPSPEVFGGIDYSDQRLRVHRIEPRSRRHPKRGVVLVVGMSENAARLCGFGPMEWERRTVDRLLGITRKSIVYRPKPGWRDAPTIDDVVDVRNFPLGSVLEGCHCTVSEHSNVAIDGLIAGVPCYVEDGIARYVAEKSLDKIDDPHFPDDADRDYFLRGVAWWQWNRAEMTAGLPWRFFKEQGLLT